MTDPAPGARPHTALWPLRLCLVLSGLQGAAGIALLAAAAHTDPSGLSETAGQMLLFHAPVILGLGLLSQIHKVVLLPAALGLMVAGLGLFCGDLVSRSYVGQSLFPMAAPTGGLLIIAGWAAIAISAFWITPRKT